MSTYQQLRDIVAKEQAILLITELCSDDLDDGDPLGRSWVTPATYAAKPTSQPVINFVDLGDRRMAVADIDSVQSQANRLEIALLKHIKGKSDFPYPLITLRWKDGDEDRELSVLELPHRMASGHLFASSFYGGKDYPNDPFRMHGGQLRFEDDLTEIYRNNPIELLLGSWQSMRRAAARIARRMTSRIDAYAPLSAQGNDDPANVMLKVNAQKTDPLIGALGEGEGALELYGDPAWKERGRSAAWTSNHPAQKTKDTKKFKASETGLGEVPTGSRGRWFPAERIRQTVSISLVGLRQEHFPLDGSSKPELDLAVQVAAASLGLLSYSLLRREGYFLRSGCSLVPKRSEALVVHPDASRTTLPIDLGADSVEKLDALYREAVDHVEKLGLSFATRAEPFDVDPELQKLINEYGKTKPKVPGRDVTSESP